MLANLLLTTLERNASNVSRLSSRLVGVVIFATIFVVPSALGQTDYSDGWIDDSNPDAAYLVGVGVTDNDYSADSIGVETTLTSPNGRTVTGEAEDYGSSRVEVTLPWDWDDLGDYFVRTRHQPLCWGNWDGSMIYEVRSGGHYYYHWNPDYFRCMASRETTDIYRAGVSFAVYRARVCVSDECGFGCIYYITENCETSCKQQQISTNRICRSYLIRKTPFQEILGHRTCLRITALDEESDNAAFCWDQDTS